MFIGVAGLIGAGKSTLAATFAAKGYPLLSDDILALFLEQDTVFANAGYPRLRMYRDVFSRLDGIPDELPSLSTDEEKCYLDLTTAPYQFQYHALPLKAIYLLDWDLYHPVNHATLSPVTPGAAIPLLSANTYRNELLDNAMKQDEFSFLTALVERVPVRKLRPPEDLSLVSDLVEIILDDCRRDQGLPVA